MDISKFPTDNLYKFIAIFGLIILIASFYYQNTVLSDINKLQSDVLIESKDLLRELEWQSRVDSLKSKMISTSKYQEDDAKRFLMEYNAERKATNQQMLEIKKKFGLAETKRKELESFDSTINFTQYIALFWMISGFILWYFKLQRYQDIIIKYEAMKIKAELEKNN